MMAPGKRTLFLNGRIPSRLGSSTDSAIIAVGEERKKREREGILAKWKSEKKEVERETSVAVVWVA